jgi:signal transduction histidine kinase
LRNLLVVAGVSLLVLSLVAAIARKLARVATRPLGVLTHTAQRVSDSRDYALRAELPPGDDEIGKFTTTFNEMLAQIERQDRDLKESRAQAEMASRLKDEFLATLSHELRTPMTPILGWAQILGRIAHDDPRVRQGADIIERNALAQTRIVDDLLDMSRIVAGKVRLQPESVRVADVLGAALDAVRVAAEAREIALDVELPADLPPVHADPHRLQQVLWNLLSNAIKFTPRNGTVAVRAAVDGDVLRIVVRDSGEGIEPAFLPHVFDRFRQADSSITRRHEGLGLGLAIVKHLVELHGGSVGVASDGHGQGATFTVDLPLRRVAGPAPAPVAARAAEPPRARPLRAMKLLIVENDADARAWLQHVLADHGAEVRAAESAHEALALIQTAPPDVLVSDIGMPGVDGYEFLRAVRRLPDSRGGQVPAIAVTAFARPEDRERALAAGYQCHLGKPVDEHALVSAVLSLLPA